MTVDLTPLVNGLVSLAASVIIAAVGVLVPALLRRLHLANVADLTTKIMAGADAAAGAAYAFALTHEGGLQHVAVQNAAIAHGAAYLSDHFADALKQLGVTPDTVSAMVYARLGALLANDPAVSAGQPAVTAALVPVPPAAAPDPARPPA